MNEQTPFEFDRTCARLASALTAYFEKEGANTAAVIIESIQGVGGITVATASFLQAIRRCCTEHGAVFIADEVQCGYGRTGKFFAADHAGVDADIYTMAKGMGNGFPIGGILIAPHLKPKHGMLGTTFGGAHLACAAALGVLEVIESENLLQAAEANGTYLMNELKLIEGLQNVRGIGLMIGFDVAEPLKDLRKNLLWKHKIFTGEAKPAVIRLLPSLAIEQTQADELLAAIRAEIDFLTETASVSSTVKA